MSFRISDEWEKSGLFGFGLYFKRETNLHPEFGVFYFYAIRIHFLIWKIEVEI